MNTYALCTAVVCFVALIKTGEALQCWECSSTTEGRCADYFNVTIFPRASLVYSAVSNSPRLVNCDSPQGYGYQKQVCMKRMETDKRFHRTTYSRSCHTLVGDERVGTCPEHPTYNDVTIDFCEYCDTHECNGAQILQTSTLWMGVLSIVGALILSN